MHHGSIFRLIEVGGKVTYILHGKIKEKTYEQGGQFVRKGEQIVKYGGILKRVCQEHTLFILGFKKEFGMTIKESMLLIHDAATHWLHHNLHFSVLSNLCGLDIRLWPKALLVGCLVVVGNLLACKHRQREVKG